MTVCLFGLWLRVDACVMLRVLARVCVSLVNEQWHKYACACITHTCEGPGFDSTSHVLDISTEIMTGKLLYRTVLDGPSLMK